MSTDDDEAALALQEALEELADEIGETRPDWQDRGLCAQVDPELFFPEKGQPTREAKRVCAGCDVRAECLDYAMTNRERFGIWGGLSERERRSLAIARATPGESGAAA